MDRLHLVSSRGCKESCCYEVPPPQRNKPQKLLCFGFFLINRKGDTLEHDLESKSLK